MVHVRMLTGIWVSLLLTCICRHTSMGLVRRACSRFIFSPLLLCTNYGRDPPRGGGGKRKSCSSREVRKTSCCCAALARGLAPASSALAPACVFGAYVHMSAFVGPSLGEARPLAPGRPEQAAAPPATKHHPTAGAGINRSSSPCSGFSGGGCADPWRHGRLRSAPNLARFESKTMGGSRRAGDRAWCARTTEPSHKRPSKSPQCPP